MGERTTPTAYEDLSPEQKAEHDKGTEGNEFQFRVGDHQPSENESDSADAHMTPEEQSGSVEREGIKRKEHEALDAERATYGGWDAHEKDLHDQGL